MASITTRSGKGSALTHAEVDANFTNLNADKVDKTGAQTMAGALTAAGFIPSSSTVQTNGINLPAANTLGFSTNSSERMRIDSSGLVSTTGNVRIGNSVTQTILSFGNSGGGGITGAPNSQEGTSFLVATAVNGAGYYPSSLQIHQNNFGSVSEVARFQEATYFRMASGTGGIQFNGDTAAANALDDYEEGTWTPSLGGTATYNIQSGTYVKVGKLVTATCSLKSDSIGTGSTTTVSGLPFAIRNTAAAGIAIDFYDGAPTSGYGLRGYVVTSTTVGIRMVTGTGASATAGVADFFATNARVYFTCTYETTA